jgi:type IV secretory pathway VirB4 component
LDSLRNILPKPVHSALSNRKTFVDSLFSRPQSLSGLLPYDEFVQEDSIFQLKDGSLGAVFEVELNEHETKTESEIISAVESLKSWFNFPSNCSLQILFEQSALSSLDSDLTKIEKSYSKAHPVSQILFDRKMKAIKESCKALGERTPLQRRAFISIRYFHSDKDKVSIKDFLSRGESLLHGQMKGFVKEFRAFKQLLRDFEANSRIKLKRLDASELLDFLRKFFNPQTYYKRAFAPYNPHVSLADQFIYNAPVLDYSGIQREGLKTRTISLKTSPQFAYPGGMAYFTRLNFPFRLSFNFSFPPKDKIKKFFDFKEFFLQNTPTAKAKIQRQEILEVQDRLAREDRCLHLTFNVVIEGESEEVLDERTRAVCNVFHHDLECEVIVEEDIGLGLCLNSLPLCYTPDSDYSSQRYIRILRSDALKFIPIFDSFRGLKNPLSVYLSRENNIVPFSLLENETSNHTVVLADSGSGKSAFVIDCIQSAKRLTPEPLVFIIDKKSSYTMLAEYFDGDLTIFDRNSDVPFTPFRGVYDEEKIAFLTKLILSAIQLTSSSFKPESEHQAAVSKALKLAYVKKCQRSGLTYIDGELRELGKNQEVVLTMEDFVTELGALNDGKSKSLRDVVDPLLAKLKPFYGDGTYAKFFKGSSEPSTKSRLFYIYDLDALDSDPVLQTLMTMSVFEEIRRIMTLPENQGRQSLLVFEEFARQGKNNPFFADFAIDYAETMRKKGGWIIALTPRPQNYFETEIGKAFWGVADNYVFLQMNSDNVDYVTEKSSLLDEASREIIRSLKTMNGKYAEVFYTNKKKTKAGAFRYWQSPLDRWMSPTNARDAMEADRALKRFSDKWKALEYLAETFPNGAPSA